MAKWLGSSGEGGELPDWLVGWFSSEKLDFRY